MRVVAIKEGYDNVKLREVGEEFDMPDHIKGSWFVPASEFKKLVDAKKAARKAPKTLKEASDEPPTTFSEIVGNRNYEGLV